MSTSLRNPRTPVPQKGHQVRLLQGGGELFAAMVQAIEASTFEVRLETYIFHADSAAQRIADALIRAAQRGVSVFLVVDGVGTPELPAHWVERFNEAGVQWQIFMPLGRLGLLIPSRWRRLHRKLCVVDGALAFCGGINLLDDRMDHIQGSLPAPRLDFAVQVRGPAVRDMHEVMARFWVRVEAVRTLQEADFSLGWQALNTLVQQAFENGAHPDQMELLSPNGVRAALVLRDNLSHRWHIERMYRKAIASARQDIWIANAYFLPGSKLRKALMHAARRGVRVRLLLQGRWKYVLQRHAVRQVYAELLAAGVEICEYVPSELHAKVAVVDGRWTTVGSSNLDPLSLLMAREANMVVVDDDFAQDLVGRLQHAAEHECRWIDAHTLQQRSFWSRRLDAGAFALVRTMLFVLGQRY